MPHLFVNRPRHHSLWAEVHDRPAHERWEALNAILYNVGGLTFIIGSVFFFPQFESYQDIGAWTFILGSLLYLIVTGHDVLEVRSAFHGKVSLSIADRLESWSAWTYLVGTCLFLIGSIFFLSAVAYFVAGALLFVVGSLLFVLGATINVLQITSAASLRVLQLMNLTAVSFVVGSVLFTVASIPYLWAWTSHADKELVYGYLAAQYLVGSVLFFVGGLFNYGRARLVLRQL